VYFGKAISPLYERGFRGFKHNKNSTPSLPLTKGDGKKNLRVQKVLQKISKEYITPTIGATL